MVMLYVAFSVVVDTTDVVGVVGIVLASSLIFLLASESDLL